jgi:membrane protein required for colicin V production
LRTDTGSIESEFGLTVECEREFQKTGAVPMPITLLDLILLGVMLISGLLAMIRGGVREILSIIGWLAAVGATFYGLPKFKPYAQQYFSNDTVATAVTAAGIFLVTLLIVSIFTVRISDRILDSRIGALDRTLGFLFGLARGLVIVVVAFIFFDWLVPPKQQPTWVANAKSRVVLQATGSWLISLLPEDVDKYISKALKKGPKGGDEDLPPDAPPDQRTDADRPGGGAPRSEVTGYDRSDRANMRQLIDSKR